MRSVSAVVLLAHGSPDPDWRRPIVEVADRLRSRRPEVTVLPAYLGAIEPSLPDAIDRLYAEGHRDIVVLAAFLSPGGRHIKRDVPELVGEQAGRYPDLSLRLRPGALGSEPEVLEAMAVAAARALD